MGKRKKSARKPQGPKKREPLPSIFACLFCNHEKSVAVKLDKKMGIGQLQCKVCGKSFQSGINYLSAPVDVYSDWVDACDIVSGAADNTEGDTVPTYRGRGTLPEKEPLDRFAGQDADENDDYDEEQYAEE
ncbi:MAG: hypothetical protein M1840_008834 [Geoglossum simile]|nr:MAG: hypothetical protein M1840_008834 [Geoglossum simile]